MKISDMTGLPELLPLLLSYLISLAAGERSAALAATRKRKIEEALREQEKLDQAFTSTLSIRDEVQAACTKLASDMDLMDVPKHELSLWGLLREEVFQSELSDWLMTGGIEEGEKKRIRLLGTMKNALVSGGATDEQLATFPINFFELIDKAIFSHPILSRWRLNLNINYLRGLNQESLRLAQENAGVFPPELQESTLNTYCEKALKTWDIIDLNNLPEGDVHIATQQLLLRQLYMPLHVEIESSLQDEDSDTKLTRFEQNREARRHQEAGHFLGDVSNSKPNKISRSAIGERLKKSSRMVVLGDPGGGKTTMLRWMATAYLLKHMGDSAFNGIPDASTLPSQSWIPVLIRCRDIGEADLSRCFTDFLAQSLQKTALKPEEAKIMCAVVLDRIAKGEALLLIDGLDEITNSQVRVQFCQELERTAARYPKASIVVTSRIVGYRDMPYRMASDFEHGVIADLNREDKDLFAERWIEFTEQHQTKHERSKRTQELIEALHSSDRIERLTGNPMLLTTLALVKRKVGKLPNRRNELYHDAVEVLLNWNPQHYEPIDKKEAIPQLEYLAYEMCRLGVQRLTNDKILTLLENLRDEYPNIRDVRNREPVEFLKLLEERSSILIRSGGAWQENESVEEPVWEFRHLTFQEYLASRALIDGRYANRDKSKSLAEQVAPLAGNLEKARQRAGEKDIPESWREALRLLVADCSDDDVDDVLLAILNPLDTEDAEITARPRAILAALCVADEPNVSKEAALTVLSNLVARANDSDGKGGGGSLLDKAAWALSRSIWASYLRKDFVNEYFKRSNDMRLYIGGLLGEHEFSKIKHDPDGFTDWYQERIESLKADDLNEVAISALGIMIAVFNDKFASDQEVDIFVKEIIPAIKGLLDHGNSYAMAAAWTLSWSIDKSIWNPTDSELEEIATKLNDFPDDEPFAKKGFINILRKRSIPAGIIAIIRRGLAEQPLDCVRRRAG